MLCKIYTFIQTGVINGSMLGSVCRLGLLIGFSYRDKFANPFLDGISAGCIGRYKVPESRTGQFRKKWAIKNRHVHWDKLTLQGV
jgi:hypothetical protein